MRIGVNIFQIHRMIRGAGRFTKNLLRALSDLDDKNEYILFLRKDNAGYYSIKKNNFTNVVTNLTQNTRFRRVLKEQYLLPRMAKKYNIDVFWSPSNISPRTLPCISLATIHDLKHFVIPEEFPFLERNYYRYFMKNTARSANLLFTVSESSGRDIMKYLGVSPERIVVVPNGLDSDILDEEGVPFESLKRIHGINRKYVLFVGRLLKCKNVPRMLRAFNKCKEAADYDFVFLGQPGNGLHEIEHTIQQNNLKNRVHHIKWATTEQLVSFYKYASALFYASLYEGFGFPLIEAMACGVPIITSNLSSMPEVAGNAALLVDPKNEEEMAEALGKVLKDDSIRKKLIDNGYERVKKFSWENTAQQYLTVFERLKKNP
jgi:glycosyltransferase involved in cell wall biosynthesis